MSDMTSPPETRTAAPRCPTCGKPADPVLRPFCSPRCRDVDLHRWFTGRYAVPAVETEDDDETADPSDPSGG
jgi:endogenous inhibitor of DNA gyrase (YacG/DUF329 family)